MRTRVSLNTAAVLAASGFSLSTLLLFAYLRLRRKRSSQDSSREVQEDSSPVPPSTADVCDRSEAAVTAPAEPDLESAIVAFTELTFDQPLLFAEEEEEEEQEESSKLPVEPDATSVKREEPISSAAETAAEESVSECEWQLEEEEKEVKKEQEEEAEEEEAEEEEAEEEEAEEEQPEVEEEIEKAEVKKEEEAAEAEAEETEEACKEESSMSVASSALLDEGLVSCGVGNSSSSSNNNNNTISNNNNTIIVDKALTVDVVALNSDISGDGGVRLSNWLARNDRFCHSQPAQHHQLEESSPPGSGEEHQHQQQDASEDSGRPSSVDTAAGGEGPVASPAASSTSVGVATAASCLAAQLQVATNGLGGSGDGGIAGADRLMNGGGCGLHSPVDRAKVIRGVSPVPGDDNDVIHQFLIPNKLGGSMVGTRGRNINYIRAKSGASVWISRNFFDKKTQVVNVRGPSECVKAALQVIKKRFPELDVKPINTAVPIQRNPALQPTMCQLSLPVGALVDVNVCAMCRGTTVFLQQPTHPSFHHLEKMDFTIMKHYADQASVPTLPRPVNPGAVCVAPFGSAWYRAIIADVYPEEDMVLMKYLDWGGYERMSVSCLKQIRTEMMHLPFQAVEGHLAYISPVLSPDEDPELQLERLSRTLHERFLSGPGRRVKCQVVYFNDVGQPCVYLYTREANSDSWRFLQEDLVQAGLAQWFQMPHAPPQMPQN